MPSFHYFAGSVGGGNHIRRVSLNEHCTVYAAIDVIWDELRGTITDAWPTATKFWLNLVVLNPPVPLEASDGFTLEERIKTYKGQRSPLSSHSLIDLHLSHPFHITFELQFILPLVSLATPLAALQIIHQRAWKTSWHMERRTLGIAIDADERMGEFDVDIDIKDRDSEAIGESNIMMVDDGDRHGEDPNGDIDLRPQFPASKLTSSEWSYDCLLHIDILADALGVPALLPPFIVILEEHRWLLKTLENTLDSFALAGQPGIGKTTALIVILLHRLEQGLPIAIQFSSAEYILFDEAGVHTYSVNDISPVLNLTDEDNRIGSCWALVDCTATVFSPCQAFINSKTRIIQVVSAARPDSWRWMKYLSIASTLVVDLPKLPEVAAIAKENGFDPLHAISLARKWGPSIRTILRILSPNHDSFEQHLYHEAGLIAARLCGINRIFSINIAGDPDSPDSPLLFMRPLLRRRLPHANDSPLINYGSCGFFIPTEYLVGVLNTARQELVPSNAQLLKLFEAFGQQMGRKSFGGRLSGEHMHVAMTTNYAGASLPLQNGSEISSMRPGRQLLAGTLDALKEAWNTEDEYDGDGVELTYYWIPSAFIFPGIDAVLLNAQDIYALQIVTPDDHDNPEECLRQLWQSIVGSGGVHVGNPRRRAWHFVVVVVLTRSDSNTELASYYTEYFGKMLKGFRLGGGGGRAGKEEEADYGVSVKVWGSLVPLQH